MVSVPLLVHITAIFCSRSLAGKLRIGLAEQSVLQALAHACVQTPLGQDYPPPIHTAYKSVDNETFKEKLSSQAFKLKTAYCECPTYDIVVPALLEVEYLPLAIVSLVS
jgi:DNA ligase-1